MKNTSKFQNVVIATIVGWLVLFVFLPNLMIIATSFLTRDDANFVKLVFTLDNYSRLLDPLYYDVLLHSLNMALLATLACLALGYPFAWFLARLPQKVRPLLLFLLIVPFWTNSLIRIYGLKIFLSTKGYLNEFLLWLGVIDTPIRIMFTPSAVIIGLVYILLPFMVMPLYSSIEKLDRPLLEAAKDLGASKLQTFIRIIIPLTMPGIIPCFYTLAFLAAALLAAVIAKRFLSQGFLCAVLCAGLSLLVTDLLHTLLLTFRQGVELTAVLSLTGREAAVTVVLSPLVYLLLRSVHNRILK